MLAAYFDQNSAVKSPPENSSPTAKACQGHPLPWGNSPQNKSKNYSPQEWMESHLKRHIWKAGHWQSAGSWACKSLKFRNTAYGSLVGCSSFQTSQCSKLSEEQWQSYCLISSDWGTDTQKHCYSFNSSFFTKFNNLESTAIAKWRHIARFHTFHGLFELPTRGINTKAATCKPLSLMLPLAFGHSIFGFRPRRCEKQRLLHPQCPKVSLKKKHKKLRDSWQRLPLGSAPQWEATEMRKAAFIWNIFDLLFITSPLVALVASVLHQSTDPRGHFPGPPDLQEGSRAISTSRCIDPMGRPRALPPPIKNKRCQL